MTVAMLMRRAKSLAAPALLVVALAALLAACGTTAQAQTAKGTGGANGSGTPAAT